MLLHITVKSFFYNGNAQYGINTHLTLFNTKFAIDKAAALSQSDKLQSRGSLSE